MMPTIYSWHPVLTPHQAHTLKALGDAVGAPIRVITAEREHAIRKAQGWAENDDRVIAPEVLPDIGWRERIDAILDDDPTAIHMIGSPFERSRINRALIGAARRRRRLFLISEPYSPRSVGYLSDAARWQDAVKARLRPAIYAVYKTLLKGRVAGVFAISPLAVEQYDAFGKDRVFPFGYFVPGDDAASDDERAGPLNAAFLGSFIARKGVATLLAAFATDSVVATGARLTLFGPAGATLPSAPNIDYRGPLPFGDVQRALAAFDLLIVPSLYDGWAVVVNEAIQAGIPVLASDAVGAAAMIPRWKCGERFPAGDAAALAGAIARIAGNRGWLTQARAQARALAPLIEPRVAGVYMADCLRAVIDGKPRPDAPWY